MFRIFIIAVLFGLIFLLMRGFGSHSSAAGGDLQELVRDAQTGVYFPKSEAVVVTRGGETLYFNSIENRDRYLSANR